MPKNIIAKRLRNLSMEIQNIRTKDGHIMLTLEKEENQEFHLLLKKLRKK